MGEDARHIRELETRCRLLEQAFLLQQKRVWSLEMLEQLERGRAMANASKEERGATRQLLEGNLRVAKEELDRVANDLGYENPSVFKLIDPEFVYGAPSKEVSASLRRELEAIDAREREAGTSHLSCMLRELKSRHDDFLEAVAELVRKDVELHAVWASLSVGEQG